MGSADKKELVPCLEFLRDLLMFSWGVTFLQVLRRVSQWKHLELGIAISEDFILQVLLFKTVMVLFGLPISSWVSFGCHFQWISISSEDLKLICGILSLSFSCLWRLGKIFSYSCYFCIFLSSLYWSGLVLPPFLCWCWLSKFCNGIIQNFFFMIEIFRMAECPQDPSVLQCSAS